MSDMDRHLIEKLERAECGLSTEHPTVTLEFSAFEIDALLAMVKVGAAIREMVERER